MFAFVFSITLGKTERIVIFFSDNGRACRVWILVRGDGRTNFPDHQRRWADQSMRPTAWRKASHHSRGGDWRRPGRGEP